MWCTDVKCIYINQRGVKLILNGFGESVIPNLKSKLVWVPSGGDRVKDCRKDVKKRKSSIRASDSPGQDRFPWEEEIKTDMCLYFTDSGLLLWKINLKSKICKIVKFYVCLLYKQTKHLLTYWKRNKGFGFFKLAFSVQKILWVKWMWSLPLGLLKQYWGQVRNDLCTLNVE